MDRLSKKPLTRFQKAAYAAPGLSLAVVGIPLYVYIPKFYTDVVGVPIAILGHIVLAARLLDGILDPAVGYLSDQTRSRHGRRRPYIAAASFALAGLIFMLYNPPAGFSSASSTIWFLVGILTLSVAWTLVDVPWEALGPELSFDYHERTSLFALRDGVTIAGIIIAAASPGLLAWVLNLPQDAAGERAKFFWFSAMYAPLVIGTSLWCVVSLRERAAQDTADRLNPWVGLKRAAQNRPFMILLISYSVAAFGSNLPATLILYYVEHVLESTNAELFLVLYLVTGILFLPGWVILAKRLEKRPVG
jgi:GPH family glycoside/pentoside/hexuronide:cation symporter